MCNRNPPVYKQPLFLHGKTVRKMSTLLLQKEMKMYFERATGKFGGLCTGLAPEEEDYMKSLFLQAERERQAEEQRRIEAEKAASEADRAEARVEIERRRKMVQELIKKAVRSVENVWYIEFKGEDLVKLYFNRSSGPLAHAKELWIHGGHNNWKDGLSIVERLVSSEKKDGDWWYANVVVPDQAVVLDWVFANGPPQNAVLYDNNHRHDFHTIVPKSIPEELYWIEEEHQIYRKLQEERRLREEAILAKDIMSEGSGVPKDMDSSSDNGDGAEDMDLSDENADGEDDTAEGGDDTEDHGSGSEGGGFYSGFNDGGDSSSDGGTESLPVILVSSPEQKDRIGYVSNYFECGSVHALEKRVKTVLRRELNKDTHRITYFTDGPTSSGIEVDISGMSWGEVIESKLQGAFAYDDLDPGQDAGASCSRPNRKRKQPTFLKDYYAF